MNFKSTAKHIAKNLIKEIPNWIIGYKITFTRYKDTNFETDGDVNIRFL